MACPEGMHPATPDATGLISRDDALRRACEEVGRGLTVTGIRARLDWWSDAKGRRFRAWLVDYEGVQERDSGPAGAGEICFVVTEGAAINAETGAFLSGGASSGSRIACPAPPPPPSP